METRGVVLNMYFKRYKGIVDKCRYIVIGKRFGLQPNTSSSAGRSAKINEERSDNFFRLCEGTLDIFSPLNSHILSSSSGNVAFPQLYPEFLRLATALISGRLKQNLFPGGLPLRYESIGGVLRMIRI